VIAYECPLDACPSSSGQERYLPARAAYGYSDQRATDPLTLEVSAGKPVYFGSMRMTALPSTIEGRIFLDAPDLRALAATRAAHHLDGRRGPLPWTAQRVGLQNSGSWLAEPATVRLGTDSPGKNKSRTPGEAGLNGPSHHDDRPARHVPIQNRIGVNPSGRGSFA